jgi:hypothetical protein
MKGKTMITSEKVIVIDFEDIRTELNGIRLQNATNNYDYDIIEHILDVADDFIVQQEELTTAVKRYFELKAKGITTEAEALEHRELLNQINEMVGIK